jgi:hypothetical protein
MWVKVLKLKLALLRNNGMPNICWFNFLPRTHLPFQFSAFGVQLSSRKRLANGSLRV